MKLNHIQVAGVLMLSALFAVPSLAFPGEFTPSCYQTDLVYNDVVYGKAKFTVSSQNEYFLEVEIEGFIQEGEYTVWLIKDYSNDYEAGTIDIDSNGDGDAVFQIPYYNPDFTMIIKKIVEDDEHTLVSGDWVKCEYSDKPEDAKISPSTLNLKSNGNWVTVKILYPVGDSEPTDFKMYVDGEPIDSTSKKISPNHITLKFSRAKLQELCEPGDNTISISFTLGDESIELSDTIKVINNGQNQEQVQASSNGNNGKPKTMKNNVKAKGKNK